MTKGPPFLYDSWEARDETRAEAGEALAPDDPRLPEALGFLTVLLTRSVRPLRAAAVETINGESAASSPYRGVLTSPFSTVREGGALRLSRRY